MPARIESPANQLPSPALRRFAWGVLVYFILVILWGTLVRATGSGAGCGNHWPLCNGTVMQPSASVNTLIEFTHRITSGLSLIAVMVLLVWTIVGTVRGHLARWAASAALILTLMEAILGALLVRLGLTAQSQSPLRPAFLALHLANTLLLLAALTLTAHLLGRRRGFLCSTIHLRAPFAVLAGLLAMLVVGVTGSLAALGDTLFPAASLGAAMQQDLSNASVWLLRWRWAHPGIALLAALFVIWLLPRAVRGPAREGHRPLALLVLGLVTAACGLGALDVLLLAPVWMQVAHLAAADSLWAALVVLAARLTLEPIEGN
jgi:cytochrome c oxidase assembly protein subunit 15